LKGDEAMREKKEGILVYDFQQERIDIRFGLEEYYGGLHCGECFDVLVNDRWEPTRIEKGEDWYLVGIDRNIGLQGLKVRM